MKSCQETFLICDFFHPYFMYINNIFIAVCVAKLNLSQHYFHTICSTSKSIILLIPMITTATFFERPWQRHHCSCANTRETGEWKLPKNTSGHPDRAWEAQLAGEEQEELSPQCHTALQSIRTRLNDIPSPTTKHHRALTCHCP